MEVGTILMTPPPVNIHRVCGAIPTVVCGNKADVAGREVPAEQIEADSSSLFSAMCTMEYFEMSVRDNRPGPPGAFKRPWRSP